MIWYKFWGPIYFFQLRNEKVELEQTLEKEQEYQVNKLMRKIEKLERETSTKQITLEQVKQFGYLASYPVLVNVFPPLPLSPITGMCIYNPFGVIFYKNNSN